MAKTYSNAPYYDDYFETQPDGTLAAKPFYKVLFKPGFAIQARELNQLQSILGHQISAIGNHLFKKNTVIIPGGVSLNKTADILCIRDGEVESAAALVGKVITNAASPNPDDFSTISGSINAIVIAAKEKTSTEPAALYVQYRNSQTSDNRSTFNAGEAIKSLDSVESFHAHDTLGSTVGKTATVSRGVFYTKEMFVDVPDQTIIVEVQPKTTNCTVGLRVLESEVSAADDETLYDNAQGSPNEYAPGADRYRIDLELARFDASATIDDDNFIRLITIENDTITYLNDTTQYAYLMDTLAHRTFDANGNFVVRGLASSITDSSDDNYVNANVSKGRCYVGGYEYSQIADHSVAIEKPRSEAYQTAVPAAAFRHTPLTYFLVAGDATQFTQPGNLVTLTTVSTTPGEGVLVDNIQSIGTAIYRGIEAYRGHTADETDIYRIILDSVSIDAGWTVSDVGGIRFMATSEIGYYIGTSVLTELSLTNQIGNFSQGATVENNNTVTSITGYTVNGVTSESEITLTSPLSANDLAKVGTGWKVEHANIGPSGFAYITAIDGTKIKLSHTVSSTITAGAIVLSNPSYGTVYSVVGDTIYLRKDTQAPIPQVGTIKSADPATATVVASFVTNYSPSIAPFIQIDSAPIIGVEDVQLYLTRSDKFTTPSSGPTTLVLSADSGSPLSGPSKQFYGTKGKDMWIFVPSEGLYVEIREANGVTVTLLPNDIDNQDYQLNFTEDWPFWNTDIIVYSTVKQIDSQSASKIRTTADVAIPTPSSSWMALDNQDVLGITKIVEGKTVSLTAASWSAGTATATITYTRSLSGSVANHSVGDVIVVRGAVSTGGANPAVDGEFYKASIPENFDGYAGFNGKHTLLSVGTPTESAPSGGLVSVTVVVTYAVAANPGTFDSSSDATMALAPDLATDTEITSRYTWDSGNTAQYLSVGFIKKIKGAIDPIGQLGVRYEYYALGGDPGDFISVNSYIEGVDNSYIGRIANVTNGDGKQIIARSSLDFRTRLSRLCLKNLADVAEGDYILKLKDLNLSAWEDDLIDTWVSGPAHGQFTSTSNPAKIDAVSYNPITGNTELSLSFGGTSYPANFDVVDGGYTIGLKHFESGSDATQYQLSMIDSDFGGMMFNYPRSSTRTSVAYTKFLPRNLMLFVNRDSHNVLALDSQDVANVNALNQYLRDPNKLPLAYIHMEPYTLTVNDVSITPFGMPGYQMVDIDQIKKRVDGLEYNVSLALDRDIDSAISRTGDRVDNAAHFGFWNEDFMNYKAHDYESDDFRCTIYDKSYVAPGTITHTIGLDLTSANTGDWVKTGTQVTLPYTEKKAFGNSAGSSYCNLNPFNRIQWEGKLRLYPSVDNWVDVTGNPPPVGGGGGGTVPFPPLPTDPPYTVPPNAAPEVVTDINIIAASWGPDSDGGKHAITFEWKTSTGRTGRVNTDIHLSPGIRKHGARGYDGTFAKSLINRKYNTEGVKEYLQAGQHFDQKSPEDWKS